MYTPVEMTKLGVIANRAFLNPSFILLGRPQAHEHSGPDDKSGAVAGESRACHVLLFGADIVAAFAAGFAFENHVADGDGFIQSLAHVIDSKSRYGGCG